MNYTITAHTITTRSSSGGNPTITATQVVTMPRKMARDLMIHTIEDYTNEGWFIKVDSEYDIWMVKGVDDPTYHITLD